jgi:thiol-disulfide isomerase/thioredoxin
MKPSLEKIVAYFIVFLVSVQLVQAQQNNLLKATNYKSMTGIDLTQFTANQQSSILKRANTEGCDCGCKMTVAQCRNDDSTCSKGIELAKAIVKDITGVSITMKAPAKNNDARIGKPLDMKFTAINGKQIDLAKMKGKVVLIDFWATWCGPCIAELPNVKKTYNKLNQKGFEIIGISLDSNENSLKRFLKKENMPWPQFFDGKGWNNELAKKHGIRSIPAMWLVDQEGNLIDTNARSNLEDKVEKLLDNTK